MEFGKRTLVLVFLYILVLYGMYSALSLGSLDSSLLRYPGDPMEHGYKIFFFSMQNAPVVYIAFFVTLVMSILYLKSRDFKYDTIASSSAKLAFLFCSLVLLTGSIFSKLAWGAYWSWDPRQTTVLFLWFILAAYLSLRASIENSERRARLSAVIGIFGFIGVPLTHVSATIWRSNHPQLYSAAGAGFTLGDSEKTIFFIMLAGAVILYAYLLWLTVRIENLRKVKA